MNWFFHQDFQENCCHFWAQVQPLSPQQNKWVSHLPKSNKITSLLSSWEEAWRTSCTISPLTHRVSSAQLTTELGTISRGHSCHREEGPSEIQWHRTCQTLYVTSITILTRNSSTGYMSSKHWFCFLKVCKKFGTCLDRREIFPISANPLPPHYQSPMKWNFPAVSGNNICSLGCPHLAPLNFSLQLLA